MAEIFSPMTGAQCAGILRHAADFVDRLGTDMPGVYYLDGFESSLGHEKIPFALISLSTHHWQLVQDPTAAVKEDESDAGRLFARYSPMLPRRGRDPRHDGPLLRLVADVAADFPLRMIRATGSIAPQLQTVPAIEAMTDGSASDRTAFQRYLERGGWPYEQDAERPFRHYIIGQTASKLYTVEISLYPET